MNVYICARLSYDACIYGENMTVSFFSCFFACVCMHLKYAHIFALVCACEFVQ